MTPEKVAFMKGVGSWKEPPVHVINPDACKHEPHIPAFDEERAYGMHPVGVQNMWPRFSGACSLCGQNTIIYASWAHYLYGDW